VWRDADALPEELVFHVDYLGDELPTFALTFSRPGAQVIAQYFHLLRLGRDGYRRVQQACRDTATWLAAQIAELGPFELVSDGLGIPAFALWLRGTTTGYDEHDVSAASRTRGWQVPAYPLPRNLEHVTVLRMVVRNGFGRDLARVLLDELTGAVQRLEQQDRRGRPHLPPACHH
jgi:glutamate decarboxylase